MTGLMRERKRMMTEFTKKVTNTNDAMVMVYDIVR